MRLSPIVLILVLVLARTSILAQQVPSPRPAPVTDQQANQPELVLQQGHAGIVSAVGFSPDGRFILTGSWDRTARLWDAGTGAEIRTFEGDGSEVNSVSFSPDGRLILMGTNRGVVSLRDAATGTELRRFADGHGWMTDAVFSPDGRHILTGHGDGFARLWEAGSGALVWEQETGQVETVAFASNSQLALAGSGRGDVVVFDVATGKRQIVLTGHSGVVYSAVFSPDGRQILTGSRDSTVRLWDAIRGSEIRRYASVGMVFSVAFSPDGTLMVAAGQDSMVRILDAATGSELRRLSGNSFMVRRARFSPDGRNVATGGYDGTTRLWDAATGESRMVLRENAARLERVAFSADGSAIMTAGDGGSASVWSAANGIEQFRLRGHSGIVFAAAISSDGRLALTAGQDSTVVLWDVATGTQVRRLSTGMWLLNAAFSPDGKSVLVSGTGAAPGVGLWDVATGQERYRIRGDSLWVISVAFALDGQRFLGTGASGIARVWDAATGSELFSLHGHRGRVQAGAFSPDGTMIATGSLDSTVQIWDAFTGAKIQTLSPLSGYVLAVAFFGNERIAVGGGNNTASLWDVRTGVEIRRFSGHTGPVTSVAVSPDGNFLLSGSSDGSARVWGTGDGREKARLISFRDGTWAVADPFGRFDGSPSSWRTMLWRLGPATFEVAPAEVFFNEFYYPGLLADVLAGRSLAPPRAISDVDRRQPQISLQAHQRRGGTSSRTQVVQIDVTEALPDATHERGSGVRDARLFRNGELVAVWRGDITGDSGRATLVDTVTLVAGENRLTAYGFNRDNIKSPDAELVVQGAEELRRRGTLYVLSVGVNRYTNSSYNLRYAVPDAQAVGAEVQRQQSGLDQFDHVEVIALQDSEATKASILAAFRRLGGTVEPEDGLIVFFAGHGMVSGDHYYLIPHDLGYSGSPADMTLNDFRTLFAHSLSDVELSQSVEGIDASLLVLIIDACQAGQVLQSDESRRGPMNSRGLAQLAYEKGMYVLASAQGFQEALEEARLGHGLLTYTLVEEGLKSATADRSPQDGRISVREWLDFAAARVPDLHRELHGIQPGGPQRPRVFYRREVEAQPVVLAKPPGS